MNHTKAQVEKAAREIRERYYKPQSKWSYHALIEQTPPGPGWIKMARWHLAQLAKGDKVSEREKVMRDILEKIAASKRKTGAQRLASSCLTFLDAMAKEKVKAAEPYVDNRCEVHDLLMGDGKCNCAKAKKGTK